MGGAHFQLSRAINAHDCRIFATEIRHGPMAGPNTYSLTTAYYESMLRCFMIPDFQQCGILGSTIFMQDIASPYISSSVKRLLRKHGNIIG